MNHWLVYMLLCADNTIYTGITNNINKRLAVHNKGKGAKYTRGRLPVKLLVTIPQFDKSQALKAESRIKKLPLKKKLELIEQHKDDSKYTTITNDNNMMIRKI